MKFKYLLLAFLTISVFGCNSGQDEETINPPKKPGDPYLKVNRSSIFARGQGDKNVFEMFCNRPWRVVIPDRDTSWIRVEPSSGRGGEGLIGLKIYFGDNILDTMDRYSQIRIEHLAPDTLMHQIDIEQQSDFYVIQDSLALVEFYYAMDGPNWKIQWDLSKPMGQWGQDVEIALGKSWDGVWMGRFNGGHRRVICIWYWYPNGLSGELPECLGRLTALQGIGFTGDKGITGQIPLKALANCNIDRITVRDCGLTGMLSKDINAFQKLDVLELGGNRITSIEKGFGDLPNLQALMLGDNAIEGELDAEWFKKMKTVVLLDLSNNNFTGNIPGSIVLNKKNLQHLRLDGNRFSGYFPAGLKLEEFFTPEYFCPQQHGYGFAPGSCE